MSNDRYPIELKIGATVRLRHLYSSSIPDRILTITEETSKSWVTNEGHKIPKNHTEPTLLVKKSLDSIKIDQNEILILSEAWLVDETWRARNVHGLANEVHCCKDVDKLRQIAAILGYVDRP
jgi:hypothetical protein